MVVQLIRLAARLHHTLCWSDTGVALLLKYKDCMK